MNLTALPGRCEEASPLSGNSYIPCNAPATKIVGWPQRDGEKNLRMCDQCAHHNLKNRGAVLIEEIAQSPNTDVAPDRGHNNPPELLPKLLLADDLLLNLGLTYRETSELVTTILAEINGKVDGVTAAPKIVETDADNGIIAAYMTRLRSTIKSLDNNRVAEKAPYLAAERACDQFFAGMSDRLAKARDILQSRGDAYTARKAAEERARRYREAQEAAAKETAKRDAERRAAQEAADLEAAAARARKQENIDKLEQAAAVKSVEASNLAVDSMIARDDAERATLATLAPTADLVRVRHESGQLSTGKQVPHVEIVDADKLDKDALWAFIGDDVKLAALKQWAKIHKHKKQMEGAIIEFRDLADYR